MKNIFSSKVFWVAVVQGVIGVWVVLESIVPGVGWVMVGKTVLDIVLRFVTIAPITLGKSTL